MPKNMAVLKYENILQVIYKPIEDLKPFAGNPRTHSEKQIEQIAKSIKKFGFTNPILLDDNGGVIAGHGRLRAAKLLKLKEVPTIPLGQMSEAQKRAYIIADNKLAENAGWDEELLKIEFSYLSEFSEIELMDTGFEMGEIDIILSQEAGDGEFEENDALPDIPSHPISQEGDVWLVGEHKILCGDALKQSSYDMLLGKERAHLVFTDPPYNVPIDGHVCGNGKVRHEEFKMASGEMSEAEFTDFLKQSFQNLVKYSHSGSIHYICMDWRHISEVLSAGKVYADLKNLCVWNKSNGGMGSLYRSKHELVFVFKNGKKSHTNNIQLGTYGRNRTNVWDYAGANAFKEERMEELSAHPTVKPLALVADAIQDCSNRGEIVLDIFGGSGTTMLAAEKTGRKARLIEMDPRYIDVTIERFQKAFGIEAVLQSEQKTYSQIKRIRGVANE